MFALQSSYPVQQQRRLVTSSNTVRPIDVDTGVLPSVRPVFFHQAGLHRGYARDSCLGGARCQSKSRPAILTERLFSFLSPSRDKYREKSRSLRSRFLQIHHSFIVHPFEDV
jgi:hypothetical protein